MAKATGQITKLQSRQSAKGDSYTVIGMEGQKQPFYDWDSFCVSVGVQAGDTVEIEHNGSSYPKVKGMKKLGAEFEKPQAPQGDKPQKNKGEQISKMCSLKAAASLLGGKSKNMSREQLKEEVTRLAEELHQWIVG